LTKRDAPSAIKSVSPPLNVSLILAFLLGVGQLESLARGAGEWRQKKCSSLAKRGADNPSFCGHF
jgi:hypothetical protein